MFTHQDPEVWADLALVLWAAGLQVRAAWTIATETDAGGIKEGQLCARYSDPGAAQAPGRRARRPERHLSRCAGGGAPAGRRRCWRSTPRTTPTSATPTTSSPPTPPPLRVLTAYSSIGEIDVERELRRTRAKGEISPVTTLIERAVRIASDELVPAGLDATIWRKLGPRSGSTSKGSPWRRGATAAKASTRSWPAATVPPTTGRCWPAASANKVRSRRPPSSRPAT